VSGEDPGPRLLDEISDLFVGTEILFAEVVTMNHLVQWPQQLGSRLIGRIAQGDHIVDFQLVGYMQKVFQEAVVMRRRCLRYPLAGQSQRGSCQVHIKKALARLET